MDLFKQADWQRLKGFQLELGLIGIGFFVLVTTLVWVLYKQGGGLIAEKLVANPYVRFAYACLIKPHDKRRDAGQQTALESFYAAQVGTLTLPFHQLM
jgi:hypothetical protein